MENVHETSFLRYGHYRRLLKKIEACPTYEGKIPFSVLYTHVCPPLAISKEDLRKELLLLNEAGVICFVRQQGIRLTGKAEAE